jgi:large conductance mechanosensitive channel
MLKEFKEFAMKGNMLDMAVGIVIGAAFGTVVRSLVDDIIMPIVAWVFGSPDFSNLFVVLRNTTGEQFTSIEAAREAGAVVLGYGLFINAAIALLIVAGALFVVVKGVNRMKAMMEKKEAEEAAANPEAVAPTDTQLLTEIRDLLKK